MVLAARRVSWQPIIYAVTVLPFTVIYALTVTPFTVQFFRTFAQSPDVGDITLLSAWPLRQVHEFFLPLFIFALEVISIQLAANAWSLGMNRRFLALIPLLVVLVFAQAFPTFSVYLDARNTAFKKNTEVVDADPLDVARVNAENELRTRQYQLDKEKHADDLRIQASLIDAQTRDLERQLVPVDASIGRLQQLAVRFWTDAHWTEYNGPDGLVPIRNDLRARLAAVQSQRQRLIANPPQGPPAPELLPEPKSQPKYEDVVQYMTDTRGRPEALLSVFVALIFPTIVLGAGYVIARYSGTSRVIDGSYRPPLPYLRLQNELAIGRVLSEARQNGYIAGIKRFVAFYATVLRNLRDLSSAYTAVHLDGDHELEELQVLKSAREEVANSGLGNAAKQDLLNYLDELIKAPSKRTGTATPTPDAKGSEALGSE